MIRLNSFQYPARPGEADTEAADADGLCISVEFALKHDRNRRGDGVAVIVNDVGDLLLGDLQPLGDRFDDDLAPLVQQQPVEIGYGQGVEGQHLADVFGDDLGGEVEDRPAVHG